MSFPQIYNLRISIQEALSVFTFYKKVDVRSAEYLLNVSTHGLTPDQINIEKDVDFIIISGWNKSYENPVRFEQILKTRQGSKIQSIRFKEDIIQISLVV